MSICLQALEQDICKEEDVMQLMTQGQMMLTSPYDYSAQPLP